MSLNGTKDNLRTVVVASGFMYGNGESCFQHLFKSGWCQDDEYRIVAPGTNVIPTIHVRDLARFVRKVTLDDTTQSGYFFAVDGSNITQTELVTAALREFGAGGSVYKVENPGNK